MAGFAAFALLLSTAGACNAPQEVDDDDSSQFEEDDD